MRNRSQLLAGVLAVAAATSAAPAFGAGFSIFEQGSKAMGMAGAFTAQADDPSAMFHNAGGIAFQHDTDFAVGFTWIKGLDAELDGADPFPGEGYSADQELLSEFPPHAYWVQPINSTWTFGLGTNTPFGLTTEWKDPSNFRGRFVSSKASLLAVDVNPTLGWQASPNLGIGFGLIGRFSSVELRRDVPQINPFTQTAADIATLKLDSNLDNSGYGWNIGILHKYNSSFSWGFSYRSQISVDYEGDAELTQNLTNTPFDAIVRTRLPFGSKFPVETAIDFPDEASLGLAFGLSPNLLLETDVNWTGWSSFEELQIVFPDGQLPSSTIPERYDDAFNYRVGLRWNASPANQWRFGVVYDETPQPEGSVSPLLPDADRTGLTLGFGHEGPWSYDVALMYLDFAERTRDENFDGVAPDLDPSTFFGTYNTRALLLGLTLGF